MIAKFTRFLRNAKTVLHVTQYTSQAITPDTTRALLSRIGESVRVVNPRQQMRHKEKTEVDERRKGEQEGTKRGLQSVCITCAYLTFTHV